MNSQAGLSSSDPVEVHRRNEDFLKRFRGHKRLRVPEYIAHQRNEDKPLEPVRHETPRKNPVRPRVEFMKNCQFGKWLLAAPTTAQKKAAARIQWDRQ